MFFELPRFIFWQEKTLFGELKTIDPNLLKLSEGKFTGILLYDCSNFD